MFQLLGWAVTFLLANSVAVAYAGYLSVASTASKQRGQLLDHAHDVLVQLVEMERGPKPADTKALHDDIVLLREHIKAGWHTHAELAAAIRICTFVLGAHSKETLDGLGKLIDNTADDLNRKFDELLDEWTQGDTHKADDHKNDQDKAA